jgi:GST-like protein
MLDLCFWSTQNGDKPLIFMFEVEQKFIAHFINIREQQQFTPEFLVISPNSKIPALVDSQPNQQQHPTILFESGAI